MKIIYSWIRTAFDFSETEARGFLILMVLVVSFIAIPVVYEMIPQEGYSNFEQDKKILDSLVNVLEASNFEEHHEAIPKVGTTQFKLREQPFNPNTASPQILRGLGLSGKIVKSIVNYRTKGGKFRIKKDLAKIYGLSALQYGKLEKWITLPATIEYKNTRAIPKVHAKQKCDINIADTLLLQSLKGIGSKLAIRIIKYRTALGGFIDTAQFSEVYGLDSVVVREMNQKLFIGNVAELRLLRINTLGLDSLSSHPYLGKKYASVIINYRKQHGPFSTREDLLKIKVVPEQNLRRIKPYLSFGL